MKKIQTCLQLAALLGLVLMASSHVHANEEWLYGKWELVFDPDGGKKDWLEFYPGGDVRSSGRLGEVEGRDGDGGAVDGFEQAAFQLQSSGDITDELVRTTYGYHIIRLVNREMDEPMPVDAARAELWRQRVRGRPNRSQPGGWQGGEQF